MNDSPRTAEVVVHDRDARVAVKDFDGVMSLLAEDVEFIQANSLPRGRRYAGRDGFAAMAARILAAGPGFALKAVAFMSDPPA